MDLRDLRYFESIAELEHVGRAAERLHRTQPALSGCLRRLDEACGTPLFEKSGRGIRLTTAGKILLKWARRLRSDAEDAQREITDLKRGLSGHIRIGLVPTAAYFLIPSAACKLFEEAPNVTLHTAVGLVASLKKLLLSGDLDLVVGTESQTEECFVSEVLTEDVIVVAANREHDIFRETPTLHDLTKYRWALQPLGSPTRDWLDNMFVQHRLPRPQVQVESTMLLTLPNLIADIGLLSFISRLHLESPDYSTRLKEVAIKETYMLRRLVVIYRENSYLPPAARRLIEFLTQTRHKL
jgi:DNA-binding transcriptional LysR family regulator